MATPDPTQSSNGSGASRTSFGSRQSFYLRVSPSIVLQTLLYLDARDVDWMNSPLSQGCTDDRALHDTARVQERTGDAIVAHVLEVLRKRLMIKLFAEAGTPARGAQDGLGVWSGKEKVDVWTDVDFRMAFYFRRSGHRHAVLLKSKQLVFPHLERQQAHSHRAHALYPERFPVPGPNTLDADAAAMPPPAPRKRAAPPTDADVEAPALKRVLNADGTTITVKADPEALDTEVDEWGFTTGPANRELQQELEMGEGEEEATDDKKPRLKVSYSGFKIFDKTLFIVLEPTASLRAARPHLFAASAPTEKRQLSVAPVRAASRSVSRGVSRARDAREDSVAGSEFADDDEEEEENIVAGRGGRAGGNVPLFRGTPSAWSPTPEPEARRRAPSVAFGRGDEEDDAPATGAGGDATGNGEKEQEESGAVGLAEKLLRRNVARGEGEGEED